MYVFLTLTDRASNKPSSTHDCQFGTSSLDRRSKENLHRSYEGINEKNKSKNNEKIKIKKNDKKKQNGKIKYQKG